MLQDLVGPVFHCATCHELPSVPRDGCGCGGVAGKGGGVALQGTQMDRGTRQHPHLAHPPRHLFKSEDWCNFIQLQMERWIFVGPPVQINPGANISHGELWADVRRGDQPRSPHTCLQESGRAEIPLYLFTLHLLTPPPQAQCPGCGVLGPQPGVLHCGTTTDPLERLLGNSTYSMGGAARYITSLSTAIKAFIDRYYPRAGKKGLLVVPELPSTTEDITWEMVTRHMVHERYGGLLAADPTIQNTANSVIEDLMKDYRGEEAERAALGPWCLCWRSSKTKMSL